MCKNLIIEIISNQIEFVEIAKTLKISLQTLIDKLFGIDDFELIECILIKDNFFPEFTLDYLFKY